MKTPTSKSFHKMFNLIAKVTYISNSEEHIYVQRHLIMSTRRSYAVSAVKRQYGKKGEHNALGIIKNVEVI